MTSDDHFASTSSQVADMLPAAREAVAPLLARGRARPLPATPEPVAEPADAMASLAGYPVPRSPHVPAARLRSPVEQVDLTDLGVAELLSAFAAGAATPSALLEALRARWPDRAEGTGVLARIDGADLAAAAADRAWRTGTPRPLEGVPFAVKDIIDVADAPVTCGSWATGQRVAAVDATVVARLRAAGAIPVLMVATTEFASGVTDNIRYGAVRNPWDAERWAGGSSSGSGAAVAARYVPFALGTDTGGSIRVPSALCGVTGLKPTYGLVPRTGVASLSWSLDHVGLIARSAADIRLVLPHLSGPDGLDPTAVPADVATAVRGTLDRSGATQPPGRPLRVGVPTSWFQDRCVPEVLAAGEETLATLADSGAEITPVDLGDVGARDDDFAVLVMCELAANHEGRLGSVGLLDDRIRGLLARGTVPTALDYIRTLRRRSVAVRQVIDRCADVDVLVTPGVGVPAPPVHATTIGVGGQPQPLPDMLRRNTAPFNVLGLPAVMLPAGQADGLPVGVQVVGRPWGDATCLSVAEFLQARTDHHRRAPGPGKGRP